MSLDFTNKLEQTQYAAALVVTGAWQSKSRDQLNKELEWESLLYTRLFRRLYIFSNKENFNLCTFCLLRYHLYNFYRHKFCSLQPLCNCGMAKEDNEHFFLHFSCFASSGQLSLKLDKDVPNLDPKELSHLMLYGSPSLSMTEKIMIIEATIQHIENSKR